MEAELVTVGILASAYYLGKYLARHTPEVYNKYFANNFSKFPGEE